MSPVPEPISSTRAPTNGATRSQRKRLYRFKTSTRRSVVKPASSRPTSATIRYLRMVQTAENASFQPIFFPSAYCRPW